MVPELDLARVKKWAEARNGRLPERARGQIHYELDVGDTTITLMECRAPWHPDVVEGWARLPVARLRYTKVRREWSLYWRDRNLRFHEYDLIPSTAHIEQLLAEVDRDPTSIFWG